MQTYNKIMLYFWLIIGVLLFIVVTYMGFAHGFEIWGFYYMFAALAVLMFFARRYMMRRMEKHLKYLENQKKEDSK